MGTPKDQWVLLGWGAVPVVVVVVGYILQCVGWAECPRPPAPSSRGGVQQLLCPAHGGARGAHGAHFLPRHLRLLLQQEEVATIPVALGLGCGAVAPSPRPHPLSDAPPAGAMMGTPAGRSTPPSTPSTSAPRTVRGDGQGLPLGWDGNGDGMGCGCG